MIRASKYISKPKRKNLITTYHACFRCGYSWKNTGGKKMGMQLYACQALHCKAYQAIICEDCLKELNPKKGLFGGSNMPDKCPVCGVGILARVSYKVSE
jgi:hypothetical protein